MTIREREELILECKNAFNLLASQMKDKTLVLNMQLELERSIALIQEDYKGQFEYSSNYAIKRLNKDIDRIVRIRDQSGYLESQEIEQEQKILSLQGAIKILEKEQNKNKNF